MKKVLMLLGIIAILTGCNMCLDGDKSKKPVKAEKKKQHKVVIRYYWLTDEVLEMGDYRLSGLHDAIRGAFGTACKKIEEASDGRVEFKEVSDILSADLLVGGTQVDPSILGFYHDVRHILAVNLNSSARGMGLQITLTHELLHALGLNHSDDPNSIMWWEAKGGVGMPVITAEDKRKLLAILDGKD